MLLVPAVVLAITCGHSRPHTAEPEADDQRDGATSLAIEDATHRATAAGTLAPRDGDTVDWLEILLPPGPRQLELEITVEGPHLPASLELYDGHGAIISHLDRRPGTARSTASARTVAGGGRVFIRIADDTDASTIAYAFSIVDHGQAEPDPPPAPPPCDPASWDAKNPNCANECNFAAPDVDTKACCKLIAPCGRKTRPNDHWTSCWQRAPERLRFEGTRIVVNIGRRGVVGIEHLEAWLKANDWEPQPTGLSDLDAAYRANRMRRNRDTNPILRLVSASDEESTWELQFPKDHDLSWWQTQAKDPRVEIYPPRGCSDKYGP
jgi:hypothetical protein